MLRKNSSKEGFTLVEILVSIAIFAVGGVAILALFIAMVDRQRQAAEITRGTEIAAMVRSTLDSTLRLPMKRDNDRIYRQISFPFATLEADAEKRMTFVREGKYTGTESIGNNTYFYQLPTKAYQGKDVTDDDLIFTTLPFELYDGTLSEVRIGGQSPTVFYVLPGGINATKADVENPRQVDYDDSDRYAFSVIIRRSTQRSEYSTNTQESRYGGQKKLIDGLFVVQVRVYKGYVAGKENVPVVEETFTISAADVPAKVGQP